MCDILCWIPHKINCVKPTLVLSPSLRYIISCIERVGRLFYDADNGFSGPNLLNNSIGVFFVMNLDLFLNRGFSHLKSNSLVNLTFECICSLFCHKWKVGYNYSISKL